MTDLDAILVEFGGDPESLRRLDQGGPELLPYATLVAAINSGSHVLEGVSAVYEWQGAPLLFMIAGEDLQGEGHLHRIRRLLAMRGDAPYLGVYGPGRLDIYRIALDDYAPEDAQVDWGGSDDERAVAFARLGNIRPDAAISQSNWISNIVLKLLTGSISTLIQTDGVSDEDAISLVGRALFTRFLADRRLLPESMSGQDDGASLFDDRNMAEKTSAWLDATFNGDLLPLSNGLFSRLPQRTYLTLGSVLRRAPDNQLFLGWHERWDHLDFAHIPVGVLSQAYELYLRNHAAERQKREGGFYTPRLIADLMVRASFRALEREGSAHKARVLDPAAGAGVFLLTAFRELVAQNWREARARPDTQALRKILYEQITGFDINEAALRFAALGLYLMSIELDANPMPVDKLRFEDLRGRVLHRFDPTGQTEGAALGSLGPLVADHHIGRYDLVVGNPPWASGTGLKDWHILRKTVASIASERGVSIEEPPLPNEGLDLPFVWRAMQWARPDGQIAFALHARLLFLQGDGMAEARQAVFEALDVTSIINGVELRATKVWPEISAPFCVLLATNRSPGNSAGFRLISPRLEASLNEAGGLRVDALNAEVIPSKQLVEIPDIIKILFRGTKLDLGLIERIRTRGFPTLGSFWAEAVGVADRGQLRGSGNGYQKLRSSSAIRKQGDGLPGEDASSLRGLREVTAATFQSVWLEQEHLLPFNQRRVHRLRSRDIYTGPLLLVHEAPPVGRGRVGVAVSDRDVVFNQSFYGYSPIDVPEAERLVRYLALVIGSELVIWMALVTSGRFGVEREVIEKATLDRMPLPDFRSLTQGQKDEADHLFEGLKSGQIAWEYVDRWVAELYGLGPRDLQVIADTLEYGLPFSSNKLAAQARPSNAMVDHFCAVVEKELQPWCQRFGTHLAMRQWGQPETSPWISIEVQIAGADAAGSSDWVGLLRAADDAAATEIVLNDGGGLRIGRYAQARYWSDSQARLLAQRIIWAHFDVLKGPARV